MIDGFLAAAGWAGAERTSLAGDASTRRYERVSLAERRAILAITPEPADQARFRRVRDHLAELGVSVPAILAEAAEAGLLLQEDFGDQSYSAAIADGVPLATLYEAAVDMLAALHTQNCALPDVRVYDGDELMRQMSVFAEHYLPAIKKSSAGFEAAWDEVLPKLSSVPMTLIHRDFHLGNLFWLPERDGAARCGVIDFQDAGMAPLPYDLVSLLKDARRDRLGELEPRLIARYLAQRPNIEPELFETAYAVMGAVRNIRILGIFVRLAANGKPAYLNYIDCCWAHVEDSLAHPSLRPVKSWIDSAVPIEKRTQGALI